MFSSYQFFSTALLSENKENYERKYKRKCKRLEWNLTSNKLKLYQPDIERNVLLVSKPLEEKLRLLRLLESSPGGNERCSKEVYTRVIFGTASMLEQEKINKNKGALSRKKDSLLKSMVYLVMMFGSAHSAMKNKIEGKLILWRRESCEDKGISSEKTWRINSGWIEPWRYVRSIDGQIL